MDYYSLPTFQHLQLVQLQLKNFSKSQEKEKLKPAERVNRLDHAILLQVPIQATLLQDLILQVPEAGDAHTMVINCTLAQEEAAIIIQETVSNM